MKVLALLLLAAVVTARPQGQVTSAVAQDEETIVEQPEEQVQVDVVQVSTLTTPFFFVAYPAGK